MALGWDPTSLALQLVTWGEPLICLSMGVRWWGEGVPLGRVWGKLPHPQHWAPGNEDLTLVGPWALVRGWGTSQDWVGGSNLFSTLRPSQPVTEPRVLP